MKKFSAVLALIGMCFSLLTPTLYAQRGGTETRRDVDCCSRSLQKTGRFFTRRPWTAAFTVLAVAASVGCIASNTSVLIPIAESHTETGLIVQEDQTAVDTLQGEYDDAVFATSKANKQVIDLDQRDQYPLFDAELIEFRDALQNDTGVLSATEMLNKHFHLEFVPDSDVTPSKPVWVDEDYFWDEDCYYVPDYYYSYYYSGYSYWRAKKLKEVSGEAHESKSLRRNLDDDRRQLGLVCDSYKSWYDIYEKVRTIKTNTMSLVDGEEPVGFTSGIFDFMGRKWSVLEPTEYRVSKVKTSSSGNIYNYDDVINYYTEKKGGEVKAYRYLDEDDKTTAIQTSIDVSQSEAADYVLTALLDGLDEAITYYEEEGQKTTL